MLRTARLVLSALLLLTLAVAVARPAPAGADIFERAREFLRRGQSSGAAGALTNEEIGQGLIEALKVGTERVVNTLGTEDGFNANPEIHIPLPEKLQTVQRALQKIGASELADDLELRLNRAAEAATPKAKQLFWDAIGEMTLEDVRGIYEGPDDAATQYFRGKMGGPLVEAMRPVVDASLSEAGAVQAYDDMMGKYRQLPFVPDVKADLTTHVLERAVDAIFLFLGREEAAIRQDPAKRTTELLQKVFGATAK